MSYLAKILYHTIIWLNIVTIVRRSEVIRLLPAHICEDVHSPHHSSIASDGLVSAMPNMQKMLLQLTTPV